MSEARSRTPLGGLDYAGALVAGLIALFLFGFPIYASPYRELLSDFRGTLPLAVRAALTWLGPAMGATLLAAVAGSLSSLEIVARRVVVVVGCVLGIAALVGCGAATFWPFWQLAGQIKADAPSDTPPRLPAEATGYPLFRSLDGGRAWTVAGAGLPVGLRIDALAEADGVWIAGTEHGLFVSRDDGITFQRPERGVPEQTKVFAIASRGKELYAATAAGLWQGQQQAKAWTLVPETQKLRGLSVAWLGDRVALGTDTAGVWLRDAEGGAFRCIDEGLPAHAQVFGLAVRAGELHAGLYSRGVFRLDPLAQRWLSAGEEAPLCLVEREGALFSGRNPGGVFVSPRAGAPWSDDSEGLPADAPIWMLASTPHGVFAGTRGLVGLFRADDASRGFVPSDGGLPPGADAIALGAGKRALLVVVVVEGPPQTIGR